MSTPEKPTLKQWLDWAKRKHRAVRNKYKAVAELRTKNNRTVVLRFANLTFKEAQAFNNLFDKFNHDFSSQIDDAINENDLITESAARDLIDELFEEKIDTALSRLTIRITHNE